MYLPVERTAKAPDPTGVVAFFIGRCGLALCRVFLKSRSIIHEAREANPGQCQLPMQSSARRKQDFAAL